jgi:hypothetical protein
MRIFYSAIKNVGMINTQTWLIIKPKQNRNTHVSFYGTTAIIMVTVWRMWHIAEFQELLKFNCK